MNYILKENILNLAIKKEKNKMSKNLVKLQKEIGLPVLIVKTGQVLIKVKYHVMFVRIIEVITLIIILLFVKHAKELVMMKN